jgi:UDP-GlcNAc:undecaprenyl-phosphate/decaprenyl-phosphate GlcNAc-1-phosphate transferase
MLFFPTLFLSMFITIALIPIFRMAALRVNIVDVPNDRKVHDHPMPKVGGIAVAVGSLVPIFFLRQMTPFMWSVVTGAWIVAGFGFLDDIKELGYKLKFFGQVAAAFVVVFYGGLEIKFLGAILPENYCLPGVVSIPLTVIAIVGVTNAINLADGLDGLAGGILLLTFICIGYLAYCSEKIFIAMMSAAMVGGIFGFLRFNTYPATLFMGDAGSQLIGFLGITLSLGLTQDHTPLSPMLPLLLLGFPVLDTLTVMTERMVNGTSPFTADKNHLHHKFMRLGLYHTEAVFLIYVIQAGLVTAAFWFRFYSEWLLLCIYLVFSGVLLIWIFLANRKAWKFERPGIFDRVIKDRLKILKEEQTLIRSTFSAVEIALPLLLIFTCFLPADIPAYVSIMSIIFALMVFFSGIFKKQWAGGCLRMALYLLIPFLIYTSESHRVAWAANGGGTFYNLCFGIVAVFVVLTVKYTRRTRGFKATPMDFLILFAALVIPNLPDPKIQSFHMGMMATKVIVLLFGYEVWICELRGRLGRVESSTIAALLVLAVRGGL